MCENIGLKYARQITNMQVNMQLIDLGIASDFKGCMLDIKIKKGCRLDILKVLGCMLDICRKRKLFPARVQKRTILQLAFEVLKTS